MNKDLLHEKLNDNIQHIQKLFHEATDLIIRDIKIGDDLNESKLLYFSDLTNLDTLQEHVLFPLLHCSFHIYEGLPVTVGNVIKVQSIQNIENALLNGNSVLIMDGYKYGYQFITQKCPQRAPQSTQSELSIKGTQQSLIENCNDNIALIRRYLPQLELVVKETIIAQKKKNKLLIIYLEDRVQESTLKELEKRLMGISRDILINTSELVEWIEDDIFSPFPQILATERPDWIATHLRDGKIALILDNSSQALITPMNFVGFFKNIDDYGLHWYIASFIRLLRFSAFIISIFLPALYVAVISFHFEIIPVQLLYSIADTRAQVPFHPMLEAFLMLLTLELMREAAIRLPAPIGLTVGIVAGSIIGQAAVQTGIVSNIMVIVVGITALASYILPTYDMGATVRLLRFPAMILAACFGLVGMIIGWMILISHLINLQSLKTPYGTPFAPFNLVSILKDGILRFPIKWIKK
ncbi:spore germination protein [Bacillus thuringiensis]|uniref:spore germination protein n=1 Tax=Bacillus thuringiensis TaxID=1428 RepID=UPI0010ABAB32|nr:spore germination protein [Bacillus thuringiensis]TJZ99910.1 spore germination protein [Bacillus thuringiensis]